MLPKFIPEAKDWPRCHLLTPRWSYFRSDDFAEQVAAQLDGYGSARVTAVLERIARGRDAERLVLCCFESDPAQCHRSMVATWLITRAGLVCDELL